jgi:chorismate synthase
VSGDVWGRQVTLTIFGESHGPAIGGVISGIVPGIVIDETRIAEHMKRRAPGRNPYSTPRTEADQVLIRSGVFNGCTTGTALAFEIMNSDAHSSDYDPDVPRPSHADHTGYVRYSGYNDYRGGGHFSGRLTAVIAFAGIIAKAYLETKGISVCSKISSIGDVQEESGLDQTSFISASQKDFPVYDENLEAQMKAAILKAKGEEDSIGGVVETMGFGLPAGIGDPIFEGLESMIGALIFAIPAVKGIEFGSGFSLAKMSGSSANDTLYYDDSGNVRYHTNHNGGILGGITTGENLVLRVAFKPTPSIGKQQTTINLKTKETITAKTSGRHDPCIVQRAVVVVESAVAFALMDALIS